VWNEVNSTIISNYFRHAKLFPPKELYSKIVVTDDNNDEHEEVNEEEIANFFEIENFSRIDYVAFDGDLSQINLISIL